MTNLTSRAVELDEDTKNKFIYEHIPGRIQLVEQALRAIANEEREYDKYYHLHVAGIAARALAQFLGLRLSSTGSLATNTKYFSHEPDASGAPASLEVKLSDIFDIPLLTPQNFEPQERVILEKGLDTINREIAHITYWQDLGRHHTHNGEIQPSDYRDNLIQRVEEFANIVVKKTKDILRGISKQKIGL